MSLRVLTYHHVGPLRPGANPDLTVSPAQFARQMEWLSARGYSPIRSTEWVAHQRDSRPVAAKPVLVTFDDGYADLTKYAFPVLERYHFPALVFVVTDYIGGTNLWDQKAGWGALGLMSEEDIRRSAAAGIEFGAHTRTHPDLSRLEKVELVSEIRGSCDALANLLGVSPSAFAYPYGIFTKTVRDCALDTFDLAFTVCEGVNSKRTHRGELRRVQVLPEDTLFTFGSSVRLGCHALAELQRRTRPRARLRSVVSTFRRLLVPTATRP